jgi:hypothetical protein
MNTPLEDYDVSKKKGGKGRENVFENFFKKKHLEILNEIIKDILYPLHFVH